MDSTCGRVLRCFAIAIVSGAAALSPVQAQTATCDQELAAAERAKKAGHAAQAQEIATRLILQCATSQPEAVRQARDILVWAVEAQPAPGAPPKADAPSNSTAASGSRSPWCVREAIYGTWTLAEGNQPMRMVEGTPTKIRVLRNPDGRCPPDTTPDTGERDPPGEYRGYPIPGSGPDTEPALPRRRTDTAVKSLMDEQIARANRTESGRVQREQAERNAQERAEQERQAAEAREAQRLREESQRFLDEQARKDREDTRQAMRDLTGALGAAAAARRPSPAAGTVVAGAAPGAATPGAPGMAGGGSSSNASCHNQVMALHQQAANEVGAARTADESNAANSRMARAQRDLFSGPCRGHPQAAAYVASAERTLAQSGNEDSGRKSVLDAQGRPCVTSIGVRPASSKEHHHLYFRNGCDATFGLRIQPANDSQVRGTGIGPFSESYITCKVADGCDRGRWSYQ